MTGARFECTTLLDMMEGMVLHYGVGSAEHARTMKLKALAEASVEFGDGFMFLSPEDIQLFVQESVDTSA